MHGVSTHIDIRSPVEFLPQYLRLLASCKRNAEVRQYITLRRTGCCACAKFYRLHASIGRHVFAYAKGYCGNLEGAVREDSSQ